MAVVPEDGLLCNLIKSRHSEKYVAPGKRLLAIYVTCPFVLSALILSSIAKQAILRQGDSDLLPVLLVLGQDMLP